MVIWPLRHMSLCYLAQDPHIHLPAFFTAFKCVFLSFCLCFVHPLVILCLSASVSERVRIQGDGIVGWAQMSPRKVQQSRAGYNTGQIRTAEYSRTQESRAEQGADVNKEGHLQFIWHHTLTDQGQQGKRQSEVPF